MSTLRTGGELELRLVAGRGGAGSRVGAWPWEKTDIQVEPWTGPRVKEQGCVEILRARAGAEWGFEMSAEVQPELSWCGNDLEIWVRLVLRLWRDGPGAPSFHCPGPMPLSTKACLVGSPPESCLRPLEPRFHSDQRLEAETWRCPRAGRQEPIQLPLRWSILTTLLDRPKRNKALPLTACSQGKYTE